MNGRQIIQPRGKVLGGSSSINGLLYIRGQPRTSTIGASSAIPAGASTTCCPISASPRTRSAAPTTCTAPAGRWRCPMSASRTRCAKPSSTQRTGRPSAQRRLQRPDPGRCRLFPAHRPQRPALVDRGRLSAAGAAARKPQNRDRRAGDAHSVLRPARHRRRIPAGRRTHTAHANAEVILAGGAFNSPQLLQLSGVGPAALLRSLGIDVVADMPGVGADLQDHLQVRMVYRCNEPITMNDVINGWRHRFGAGLRYMLSRKGLLTIGAGYAGAFLRTRPELATPDVQIHFLIYSADAAGARCMTFPASRPRSASCARKAAASCASSRPIRRRRRRSSRITCRAASIATPSSPACSSCAGSWTSRRCAVTSPRS